ncbi:MAG: transporter, permease protein [Myxococcaceae bacterium]|nr:transporter, permease protein [Myxococcaceae bacterium]
MRNILTIARKELSIYFTTPWGWIGGAAMAFISSFFFIFFLNSFKEVQDKAKIKGWANMDPDLAQMRNLTDGVIVNLFGWLLIVTLLIAPFLAMRLFAEERRQKTIELLFTVPVRTIEIVLGKYLGGVGAICATLGVTVVYPIILGIFGASQSGSALEWSTVALGYGALLLWGAVCMGVGMFISALTESQMLAAVLTLVVLLLWTVVGALAPSAEEPWRSAIRYVAFDTQLQNLMSGVLDLKAIVFFVSIILLSVLFTHRAVEAQRWT